MFNVLIEKEPIVASNVPTPYVERVEDWKDGAMVGDVWSASRKLRPAY